MKKNTVKKYIKTSMITLFLLCFFGAAAVIGVNAYIVHTTSDEIDTGVQHRSDCILVLGCLVRADGSPSDMLADRLDTAIALYNAGVSDKIVMSGDHGTADYDEVNAMKQYAIDRGVPSEAIFMDHAGFSTYESMYRLKNVFSVQSVTVVTQKYHLHRALHIADSLGLDALGQSADPRTYRGQFVRDIREMAARSKDFITSILQPPSTYVGSPIPISGSGDVTNDKDLY